MANPIPITDSFSVSESQLTSVDGMTGIERVKWLLERTLSKMTDLLAQLLDNRTKKGSYDLDMMVATVASLLLCCSSLELDDDSDEEEGDSVSDEYCEGSLHDEDVDSDEKTMEREEKRHLNNSQNAREVTSKMGSQSESARLDSSYMRSQMARLRGLKRAKFVLEQVLYPMTKKYTRVLKSRNMGMASSKEVQISFACLCILFNCYKALDEEDDGEEEEDNSNEQLVEHEEQYQTIDDNQNVAETISDSGGPCCSSLSSTASSKLANRPKRHRDEEPSLVTRSRRKCS